MMIKTEIKVILVMASALVVGEVGSRVFEPRLSADIRQMLAFEEIPQGIAEAQAKGRPCILVLGNSLAKAAVDRETLTNELQRAYGGDPHVVYLAPDASGVNEWTAVYRKYFPPGSAVARPDFLIVVTGPGHLLDHPVRHPEKLSAFLVAQRDRGEILGDWLTSDRERFSFFLAGVSRLFANRERIRPLMFYNMVPGYEETAQRLNRANVDGRHGAVPTGDSARRFGMLLDSLGVPPDRVVLAAAPLPDPYHIPEVVLETAVKRGIAVFQGSASEEWPPDAFPDGYHLGAESAKRFTKDLANSIIMSRDRLEEL